MKLPGHHALAIAGLAALLALPAILSPPMTHDSFWIDWTWADQFTRELQKGSLYPRWLPQSHGGLGSPVFYYYPPLAFYVTGLFGLAGLSTYASIIGAFVIGFAASGFAMHAWLRERASAPLLGALVYMAAPYHVLDFYGRGALAEFTAIALIPLVALGLRRASEGRVVLGAVAYGAMILAHPPLALLLSIFFIAPYALLFARDAPRKLFRIGIALLTGLAISAVYLVPAVALEPYRDADSLWYMPVFRPENWSVFAWSAPGPDRAMRIALAAILIVLSGSAAALFVLGRQRWGAYALICCVLAGGLIPGFWTLPLLEKVQFPFRLFPLAEFAIATAVAQLGLLRPAVAAATLPIFAPSATFLFVQPTGIEVPMERLVTEHPDVPEHLPPGDHPYRWPSEWALGVSRAFPHPVRIGEHTIERVFHFPAWEVRCQGQPVPTAPEPTTKLLSYKGAGCQRRLVPRIEEMIGWLLSLAGVGLLIGLAVRERRSAGRERRSPNPGHSTFVAIDAPQKR